MTQVKLCGITRTEDAALASDLGAWAVGTIFVPDSPRRCDPDVAAAISSALRRSLEVVGVFANAPLDEVVRLADFCGLTMLQLHGDEGATYCDEVAHRTGAKVMKAVRVRDAGSIRAIEAYRRVDYHLLDAWAPGLAGGTGERFDWRLARLHRGQAPVVLAGGLDHEHVGEAVATVRPFAVDTASGTESAPGVKDPELVERFFAAVACADAEVPA